MSEMKDQSAGGHMAAMLSVENPRQGMCALWSACIEFETCPTVGESHNDQSEPTIRSAS